MLLQSLLAWVSAEFHAIRYRNELEADQLAGERTGAHDMAAPSCFSTTPGGA
jgi:hypothetical protein